MTKGVAPKEVGIETAFIVDQEGKLLAAEVSYVPSDVNDPTQGYIVNSAKEMIDKSKSKLPVKVALPKEGIVVNGKYKDASG